MQQKMAPRSIHTARSLLILHRCLRRQADPHCYCVGCCPEHWNRSTRHLFLPKPAWVPLECTLSFHLPPHRRRPLGWSKWCIPHIRTRNVVLHVALFTIVDFLKAFRVSYSDPGETRETLLAQRITTSITLTECRRIYPLWQLAGASS